MQRNSSARARQITTLMSILLMLLPIAYFYRTLMAQVVDIPYQDDYYAVLRFLNTFSQLNFHDRTIFLLTDQHGEYKLIFEHMVFVAQHAIAGRANFVALIAIGSLFVFFIFLLVLQMSITNRDDPATSLLLFVPCAFLLFQFQYASALNWAMTSLQYLPGVFFSLLCIFLLTMDTPRAFLGACVSLFLAAASSPNGFFVVPIGLFVLQQSRRAQRMILWCTTAFFCVLLYLWKYRLVHQGPEAGAAPDPAHSNRLLYALSFLGSSGARAQNYGASIALGLILLAVFLHAVWKKYYRVNLNIFAAMLYLLVTSAGVAVLRGQFGIAQSLASRYRIYSNLYLVLTFVYLTHVMTEQKIPRRWKQAAFGTAMLVAVAFAVLSDRAGKKFLEARKAELIYGMLAWEDPGFSRPQAKVSDDLAPVLERQREANLFRPNDEALRRSMELGIYEPPTCPATGRCPLVENLQQDQ